MITVDTPIEQRILQAALECQASLENFLNQLKQSYQQDRYETEQSDTIQVESTD